MSPARHAAASVVAGIGCYAFFGSWQAAAGALVAGVALDVDHFADYALNRLGRFRMRKFLEVCSQYRLRRFYLIAHSLEWIVPFLLFSWSFKVPPAVSGASVGLAVHMAMDLAGNGMRLPAYFFFYRLRHGFDPRKLLYRLPPEGLAYWGSFPAFIRGRPAARAGSGRSGTMQHRSGMM